MGLNTPTAFWKNAHRKKSAADFSSFSISWTTGIFFSRGNEVNESAINSPIGQTQTFPFAVKVDGDVDVFYSDYSSSTSPVDFGGTWTSPNPYYGWYLLGGYNNYELKSIDLSAYHQGIPWKVNSTEARIEFEADHDTAYYRGEGGVLDERFNKFIQSGNATGIFTVTSDQAPALLTIKVSGLGEDQALQEGGPFDIMQLHLERPNGTTALICSGRAHQDGRNTQELETNYDVQQVKLYSGGLTGIANHQRTPSTSYVKGEPRNGASVLVDQNTRIDYTNTNGIGTFTATNLLQGTHKIKIKASTHDGVYNSGAFYGFNFTLS